MCGTWQDQGVSYPIFYGHNKYSCINMHVKYVQGIFVIAPPLRLIPPIDSQKSTNWKYPYDNEK